ncbi:MAG: DUF881 domain-containing protein [Nocardioidaceae bacterium]|nr:DUF881 domain-containing protein [Nocardioidaceae bacterium]
MTRPDDDDEYAAADRGGPSSRVGLATATAALAVLLTVAAVQTQAAQPQDERDREVLLERLAREKTEVAVLGARAESTAAEVEELRASTLEATETVQALQAQLDTQGATVGSAPVRGPGVRVVVDDSDDGAPEGTITDSDLQQLVNGLWKAGAEAIAVNGQRLTTLSAIRTAGQAITVNYRSLTPPYTVAAIGDPETLPARLLETAAGQMFSDLSINFGVQFEVEAASELGLPAGSRLELDVATASTKGGDGA